MSIDEQPMNVYWSGKRTETSNNFKTNYKGSVATKDNLPSLGNKIGDMYNVIESGENFIWNGSSWDSLSGDTLKTLNWQKSEKASTVTIYPIPETLFEPIVDFSFSETLPISGQKSPSNPSSISGVSSITVTHCETVGVNSTDYTVSLGGTYYGGSVDLATGTMTVTWHGEYISSSMSVELLTSSVRALCSITKGHMGSTSAPINFRSNYDDDGSVVYPRYSAGTPRVSVLLPFDTLGLDSQTVTTDSAQDAVDAFLVAHPCFVTYKIYAPYTVQLSPIRIFSLVQTDKYTPRLNTIYTDATSIQIGYAKSPIYSEYEFTQAITSINEG